MSSLNLGLIFLTDLCTASQSQKHHQTVGICGNALCCCKWKQWSIGCSWFYNWRVFVSILSVWSEHMVLSVSCFALAELKKLNVLLKVTVLLLQHCLWLHSYCVPCEGHIAVIYCNNIFQAIACNTECFFFLPWSYCTCEGGITFHKYWPAIYRSRLFSCWKAKFGSNQITRKSLSNVTVATYRVTYWSRILSICPLGKLNLEKTVFMKQQSACSVLFSCVLCPV